MNRSLTPEDLDLILDNQHVAIPAIVKEALMTTDIDLPLDYATYSGDFCWVVSRQNAYVWNFKNQHELIVQNKKRVSHLRLPSSGFTYSAQLINVFEKEKGRVEPSVAVISREGSVRIWQDYTKDKHLDANLSINHEIIQTLHLLDVGSDLGPTVFMLVTTFGSVFALSISPAGDCSVVLVGAREGQGFTGKLTNLFFGSGTGANPTQVNASVLYWREGEEIEDIEEENQDALVITVGSNLLMAYDVSNKSSVWSVETKQMFGTRLAIYFQKRDKVMKPDVSVIGLDVQAFRQGVLVLLAGFYAGNSSVSLFIAYLDKLDYGVPNVPYFQEIKGNVEISEMFDSFNEATYLHHVRLRIPRETSLASSLYKTDGVFVIHPCFIHSLYLPDDLSKNVEIPFVKTHMVSSGKQLIGCGADNSFCYVMTGDVKTAALRLLPKGFESCQSDDVNILDVVSNLPMPEGNPEGMDLYQAFVEFCDKDINKATKIAHSLAKLSAEDLLQLVYDFVWSVFEDLADFMDVEGQLNEKKIFLDYFVLYLKHNETLSAIFTAPIFNPRLELTVSGREVFAEVRDNCYKYEKNEKKYERIQLYERISVLSAIHKWKNSDTEHADILRHLGFQMAKELRFREDGQFLAYKFNLLHIAPVSGVNLCRELLEEGVFKEATHRFEMLSYSAELLLEYAQAIKVMRKGKTSLPASTGGPRWTNKFVEAYTNMGLLLIEQLTEEIFNPNEKLKFVQLITRLLNFNFTESPTKPDSHPVLRELYKIGEERLTLELAELHKDFNIVCRICLEKGDDDALERYKVRFANENFEEYYFNYLNRKEMYTDLLDQKGENADKFIATLDHIRWRRELRQDHFTDAAKTLLMESEKKNNSLQRQKIFVSLAKLSYLCSDDSEMHAAELDDIDLTQHLIEYQESLPTDYLQQFHTENEDRLLRVEELLDLCKRRLKDIECQLEDHYRTLIFAARLVKYSPAKKEYVETRQLIWESVIRADNWSLVQESDFNGTAFAQLFRVVLKGEEDMIEYSLPDCDALLVKTAAERKKCPSSTTFIKYCIEETQKELEP